MNNNVANNNSIGTQLKNFYKQGNISNLDFRNITPAIKKEILRAKTNLDRCSYKDKRLYYKLKAASQEIKLIESSGNKGATANITSLCRVVDAMNKIGHVYKDMGNKSLERSFMFAKAASIQKLGKECARKNNRSCTVGFSRDNTKQRNKTVFAVNLPKVGQVSWHVTDKEAQILKGYGIGKYPHALGQRPSNRRLAVNSNVKGRYQSTSRQTMAKLQTKNIKTPLYAYYRNNCTNRGLLTERQSGGRPSVNRCNPFKDYIRDMAVQGKGTSSHSYDMRKTQSKSLYRHYNSFSNSR